MQADRAIKNDAKIAIEGLIVDAFLIIVRIIAGLL